MAATPEGRPDTLKSYVVVWLPVFCITTLKTLDGPGCTSRKPSAGATT